MPAVSQAQRGYLAATKGPEWMRKHHYDNPGKLPARKHDKIAHALTKKGA